MNFKKFRVNQSNIFPIANSSAGGQLFTEYNIRTRESVCTDPNVKYMIGPSYTHSMTDFQVSKQQDSEGTQISSTVLQISAGRAVINGYFIESLSPVLIDIAEYNTNRSSTDIMLKGNLSVGLKVYRSTEQAIAGSMLTENTNGVYEGIQVVILPTPDFITPGSTEASKTDYSVVTADIKLADFIYYNNNISNIVQNSYKVVAFDASRISGIDDILSDTYISKSGLNTQNHNYVYSSKSNSEGVKDTWCPADEALMIWDNNPELKPYSEDPNFIKEARFERTSDGKTVQLTMPHKQIDGLKDVKGNLMMFSPKSIKIPSADYNKNLPGILTGDIIKVIKNIQDIQSNWYTNGNGNQIAYLSTLNNRNNLPGYKFSNDIIGDYVIVGNDLTLENSSDSSTISTMYVILPEVVSSVVYVSPENINSIPLGIQIAMIASSYAPDTTNPDAYNTMFDFNANQYRGRQGDYFIVQYEDSKYLYQVDLTESGTSKYSDPIYLTRQIELATETTVGGFLNVPDTALDGGYVYLDDTGHLRLLDYALLRSGTAAYQLGQNWDSGEGLTYEAIQENLNDMVNQRIAFPDSVHGQWVKENAASGAQLDVINLYLRLQDDEDDLSAKSLIIRGIDSRFNTSVYLHILGEIKNPVNIYIIDCEKIRIDNSIPNNVSITTIRSNIYYDSNVISLLTASECALWYTRYSTTDPEIYIDGMTVRSKTGPTSYSDMTYFNENEPNDIHYSYAVNSVSFLNDLTISNIELAVKNDFTSNIVPDSSVVIGGQIAIPQSSNLSYPANKVTHNIKVEGYFANGYPTSDNATKGYMMYDNSVTVYIKPPAQGTSAITGTIGAYVKSKFVPDVFGIDPTKIIPGWSSSEYHIISGGIVD